MAEGPRPPSDKAFYTRPAFVVMILILVIGAAVLLVGLVLVP